MRSYLHDAIGVIDHVRCREEHTAAPHKAGVLADRKGNEQWQVVYQGCIAQHPCSRVEDVKGVTCIVTMCVMQSAVNIVSMLMTMGMTKL